MQSIIVGSKVVCIEDDHVKLEADKEYVVSWISPNSTTVQLEGVEGDTKFKIDRFVTREQYRFEYGGDDFVDVGLCEASVVDVVFTGEPNEVAYNNVSWTDTLYMAELTAVEDVLFRDFLIGKGWIRVTSTVDGTALYVLNTKPVPPVAPEQTKIYYVVSDNGDGSGAAFFSDKKFDIGAMEQDDPETWGGNEGQVGELVIEGKVISGLDFKDGDPPPDNDSISFVED